MGFGGDIFLQTGYYLIRNLLGINNFEEFDLFLSEMLPPLLEMERQVVNEQLDENSELIKYVNERIQKNEYIEDEIKEKITVLREREEELNKGTLELDNFEPDRIERNKHVERFD
jgi:DNA-binding protein H-NS